MDQPCNVTLPEGFRDTKRINYYKSYITELKRAIDDGATMIGYFAWSLLDNFKWRLGYTSRFGLVYMDFKTNMRYPKESAYWFKNMLKKKKTQPNSNLENTATSASHSHDSEILEMGLRRGSSCCPSSGQHTIVDTLISGMAQAARMGTGRCRTSRRRTVLAIVQRPLEAVSLVLGCLNRHFPYHGSM
ncbi:Glycosyl hydrolase family 1, partial [Musa troglodytarum]